MIQTELPDDFASTYDTPFTTIEIQHAIWSGGANKAPGRDGLEADFYKVAWPIIGDDLLFILNSVFFDGTISQ
jgi:hypothetical protein